MGRRGRALVVLCVLFLPARPAYPALPAYPAPAAQVPYNQAIADLASKDPGARARAAQMLKEASYPEAAVPLASAIADETDAVQLEAIAAELNIFLAEKIVPRKRVGLVIEKRNAVLAEPAFTSGPLAIGPRPVPAAVLTALRTASRDENPRVAVEALYAFGVLSVEPAGSARRELLKASAADLTALLGVPDPAIRFAAVRVIGRLFAPRLQDGAVDESVGDAMIRVLNDTDRAVKAAAMQALGALRYARAVQALTELFQYYGKGDAAAVALDAIARIAHPSSAPLLGSQMTSKTALLRLIAIEGLARLGNPAVLDAIQRAAATDRSERVALAAGFASALLANGPVDAVTEALNRQKLRDQAFGYLVELAPGRSTTFTRQLQDPKTRLRADVLDAIALGRDAAALPLVDKAIGDPDVQVARSAERARAWLRAAGRPPS
jgi:HEAT repeat protein